MQNNTYFAYIINVKKYKEKDAILTLLTKNGIKTVFGKSYRSIKSKYHSLNNVFLKIKITGYETKKLVIRDYDILDYTYVNFFDYKENVKLTKVVNLIKLNEYNDEEIWNYFEYILRNIRQDSNDIYYTWLVTKVLKKNNIDINFKKCCVCGNEKNIKTLSMYDGGLICKKCYSNQKIKKIKEIQKINLLFSGKIKDIEKVKYTVEEKNQIEELLNESLGIYIKE